MLLKLAETENSVTSETKLERPDSALKPSVAPVSDSGIRWQKEKLSNFAMLRVPDWD